MRPGSSLWVVLIVACVTGELWGPRQCGENAISGPRRGRITVRTGVLRTRRKVGRVRAVRYDPRKTPRPAAYVHIRPSYAEESAPQASRKCVQCRMMYNPCAEPTKIVAKPYRYRPPASEWRGLKYALNVTNWNVLAAIKLERLQVLLKEDNNFVTLEDCKAVLNECGGDVTKAAVLLRNSEDAAPV